MWIVCDVDGVMTDGTVSCGGGGRSFSVRDGHGIQMWLERGGNFLMMSRSASEDIKARARSLELKAGLNPHARGEFVWRLGVNNKRHAALSLLSGAPFSAISDDIYDLPLLEEAVFAFCPKDAEYDVIRAIRGMDGRDGGPFGFVLGEQGGRHCVRSAINTLLDMGVLD